MPAMTHARAKLSPIRLLLTGAAAIAIAFAGATADAQSRGMTKPTASYPGAKPGWSGGGNRGWHGGNHGHWRGGWHGHGWRGHYPYWRGYYGGRYYYPGWALGLGVGIGLTYPWWGWYPYYGYPSTTVVYERVYDAPVGVVVGRDGPGSTPAPAAPPAPAPTYRWYCPSPAGYHPEVAECAAGWLKVLPNGGPPGAAPRSSAPVDDDIDRDPHIAPAPMGNASTPRIAAPRMAPPAQLARSEKPAETLAHNAAH